jgi:hypothetical protein
MNLKPILAAVLWQSHRSGNWICEVYNKKNGRFLSVGIGQTKKLAESRAYANEAIKHIPIQTENYLSPSPV